MNTVNLMAKFPLGMTVITPGVLALLKFPMMPAVEVSPFINRHASGDWGNVHPDDVGANEHSLEEGSRLMSVYELYGEKIWIFTEADRSVTTVMLPDEY
jgi:hypothetical protein